jgi:hypothetical protein
VIYQREHQTSQLTPACNVPAFSQHFVQANAASINEMNRPRPSNNLNTTNTPIEEHVGGEEDASEASSVSYNPTVRELARAKFMVASTDTILGIIDTSIADPDTVARFKKRKMSALGYHFAKEATEEVRIRRRRGEEPEGVQVGVPETRSGRSCACLECEFFRRARPEIDQERKLNHTEMGLAVSRAVPLLKSQKKRGVAGKYRGVHAGSYADFLA